MKYCLQALESVAALVAAPSVPCPLAVAGVRKPLEIQTGSRNGYAEAQLRSTKAKRVIFKRAETKEVTALGSDFPDATFSQARPSMRSAAMPLGLKNLSRRDFALVQVLFFAKHGKPIFQFFCLV